MFCRACGGSLHSTAPLCPHCGAPQVCAGGGDGIARTFANSISICFRKYITFTGRAPRAEFWYFLLFIWLVGIVLVVVSSQSQAGGWFNALFSLGTFLPCIAVQVRRLHDVDRSGWWYWIMLIPIVGAILLLVWTCTRGSRGSNRFGPENGAVA